MKKITCLTFQCNPSGLKDISSVSNRKSLLRILLNQKNRCSTLTYLFNDIKNLIYKNR